MKIMHFYEITAKGLINLSNENDVKRIFNGKSYSELPGVFETMKIIVSLNNIRTFGLNCSIDYNNENASTLGYNLNHNICLDLEYCHDHIDRIINALIVRDWYKDISKSFLGLNITKHLSNCLQQYLSIISEDCGAVKLIVSKLADDQIRIFVEYAKRVYTTSQYEKGFKICISKRSMIFGKLAGLKLLPNDLNITELHYVHEQGYNEAIHLTEEGFIAEGCITNIFWWNNNELFTPDLSTGILPGIMRKHVIQKYKNKGFKVNIGRYSIEHLYQAQSIFLTNALMGEMKAFLNNRLG